MSCNCNQSRPCNSCSTGATCGCPEDLSMTPLIPDCGCCPPGYRYVADSLSPNTPCECLTAMCTGAFKVAAIPCEDCEDSIGAECVFLPAVECLGIAANTSLASVFETLFCSPAFAQRLLITIANDQATLNGFCNVVAKCGTPGSTVPVPGSFFWTIP